MRRAILGVDIGGVIIDRLNEAKDPNFFRVNYLSTPAVRGAFGALAALQVKFDNNIFLVSKVDEEVGRNTLEWFEHHDFFTRTGILRENIRFCKKRSDKARICEVLGITHFVDDRLEILSSLKSVDKLYLFRPRVEEVSLHENSLHTVTPVESWLEILQKELIPEQTS